MSYGVLPICAGMFPTWSAPSDDCTDDQIGIAGNSIRRFGVEVGELYAARPALIRSSGELSFPTVTFVLRRRPAELV